MPLTSCTRTTDVCACSHDFTCSKCAGTPFDPRYEEDAYEPMSEPDFEALSKEPDGRWTVWLLP